MHMSIVMEESHSPCSLWKNGTAHALNGAEKPWGCSFIRVGMLCCQVHRQKTSPEFKLCWHYGEAWNPEEKYFCAFMKSLLVPQPWHKCRQETAPPARKGLKLSSHGSIGASIWESPYIRTFRMYVLVMSIVLFHVYVLGGTEVDSSCLGCLC